MASLSHQSNLSILDIELAMSQIGDEDALNDMLRMLHESLARDVPLVSTLLDNGDVAGANRLLHALKGFVPIFCAEHFCSQVAGVELLSKDPASTTLDAAYAHLRPQLERLLAEVSLYLDAKGIAS